MSPSVGRAVRRLFDVALYAVLLGAAWLHVVCAPYTKVEESFTLQAVHDILAYGIGPYGKQKFDHVLFPGAVPRSFVGPLALAVIGYPVLLFAKAVDFLHTSADAGFLLRLLLATLYVLSVLLFGRLVLLGPAAHRHANARHAFRFFVLLSACQFHTLFWAGRTTPNGVVMPWVVTALALVFARMRDEVRRWRARLLGVAMLTMATVIARVELVGILTPIALYVAWSGRSRSVRRTKAPRSTVYAVAQVTAVGLHAALLALVLSVPLDTHMWSRPWRLWNPLNPSSTRGLAWPELEAMLFNVVEGKSDGWGTSPWHSYVTQHIPKLISPPFLALVLLGARAPGSSGLLLVVVSHVATVSLLGHKETRFISYLAPLFNVVAARGAVRLWLYRGSRRAALVSRLLLVGLLASTLILTIVSLVASAGNYPGGEALAALHALRIDRHPAATVHIDVLPAMTGVSLFQSVDNAQRRTRVGAFGLHALPSVLPIRKEVQWSYDKTEGVFDGVGARDDPLIESFTFLLSDDAHCHRPTQFEPIRVDGKPMAFSEFAGLRLFVGRGYVDQLRRTWARRRLDRHAFLDILPIRFAWRDVVWLCEKRIVSPND